MHSCLHANVYIPVCVRLFTRTDFCAHADRFVKSYEANAKYFLISCSTSKSSSCRRSAPLVSVPALQPIGPHLAKAAPGGHEYENIVLPRARTAATKADNIM